MSEKSDNGLSALAGAGAGATAEKKVATPADLLSPEAQAYTSGLISAAIKGVFEQLGPILESVAMTPEKIAAAEEIRRAPTKDDLLRKQREVRERKMMQEDAEENRANLLRNQANCPHKYPTGAWAVNPVRNYPDRRERFICSLCQSFFEPKRWCIGPPDNENPRGKAYIADAHPQYMAVRECLAAKG